MRDDTIETLTSRGIPDPPENPHSDRPFAEQALAAMNATGTNPPPPLPPTIPPPGFRVAQWIMRLLDWALKKSQPNPPPTPPDPPPEDRPAIMAYIEQLAAAGVTPA